MRSQKHTKFISRIRTYRLTYIHHSPSCLQTAAMHLLPGACGVVVGPVGVTGFVGRRPVVTGEAEVKYIQINRAMIRQRF
jgi:hypothetical protein